MGGDLDFVTANHEERRWTDSLLPGAMARGEKECRRCSVCKSQLTMAEIIESHCITCAEIERKVRP
jgi:hypothetical protein